MASQPPDSLGRPQRVNPVGRVVSLYAAVAVNTSALADLARELVGALRPFVEGLHYVDGLPEDVQVQPSVTVSELQAARLALERASELEVDWSRVSGSQAGGGGGG